MLEITELASGYGKVDVLRGVSLTVPPQSIVGILGPNGAGKTTLLRTISMLNRVSAGDIRLDGRSISSLSPEAVVMNGIVQVPQGRMLFPDMTAQENLELGAYLPAARKTFEENRDKVERYFPVLRERREQDAGFLSGGEQQMLAIGRALMSNPRILLLDEPSLGLAPRLITDVYDVIRRISRDGVSIVICEQNPQKVLECADSIHVMENGRIALSEKPAALMADPRILQTYLGISEHR